MSHDSREERPRAAEYFCIHSYAGEAGPPCGWRGAATELAPVPKNAPRRCPRCGRATLLEIPPQAASDRAQSV